MRKSYLVHQSMLTLAETADFIGSPAVARETYRTGWELGSVFSGTVNVFKKIKQLGDKQTKISYTAAHPLHRTEEFLTVGTGFGCLHVEGITHAARTKVDSICGNNSAALADFARKHRTISRAKFDVITETNVKSSAMESSSCAGVERWRTGSSGRMKNQLRSTAKVTAVKLDCNLSTASVMPYTTHVDDRITSRLMKYCHSCDSGEAGVSSSHITDQNMQLSSTCWALLVSFAY